MAKLTTALLIIALVVCSTSLISAGRPNPTFHHQSTEVEHTEMDENESCHGLNEEECLIRRTLVAHTDYIYTQHNNP